MRSCLASPRTERETARYAYMASEDHRAVMAQRQRDLFCERTGLNEARRRDRHFGVQRVLHEGHRSPAESPPPGGRLDDVRAHDADDTSFLRHYVRTAIREIFPPRIVQPSTLSIIKPQRVEETATTTQPPVIDTRDVIVRWRLDTPRVAEDRETAARPAKRLQPLSPFREPTASNPGPEAVLRPAGLDELLDRIERNAIFEEEERQRRETLSPRDRDIASSQMLADRVQAPVVRLQRTLSRFNDTSRGVVGAPPIRSGQLHSLSVRNRAMLRPTVEAFKEAHEEARRAAVLRQQQQRVAASLGDIIHQRHQSSATPLSSPAAVALPAVGAKAPLQQRSRSSIA